MKHYKPYPLSFLALCALLGMIIGLIALIEYAFLAISPTGNKELSGNVAGGASVSKRQNYGDLSTSTIITSAQGSLETLGVVYEWANPCNFCAAGVHQWLKLGTVTLVPTQTTQTTQTASGTFSTASSAAPPSNATDLVYVFTSRQYFAGAFLPTLIAVVFAIPWAILDAHARSLESFHQLSKQEGAPVFSTLCIDYYSPFAAVKALVAGHWTSLLTSLLNFTAKFITPLAPEFISIKMLGNCDAHTTGCVPVLKISSAVGRTIQALLGFMASLIGLLIFRMRTYSTGVFAEPHSIAGLATLFYDEKMRSDFRQALLGASQKQVYESLMRRRYRLEVSSAPDTMRDNDAPASTPQPNPNLQTGQHHEPDSTEQQSIATPSINPASDLQTLQQNQPGNSNRFSTHQQLPFSYPHRTGALGLSCVLLGLLAIIIYYKSTDFNNGFENFMDSQGFGVAFLFTSVGVLISIYWGSLFQEVAMLEPYRRLATHPRTAQDSILVTKYSSPITAMLPTLCRGHLFVGLLACSTFLVDALTVCLSNIHFKTSTTYTAFTVSTWLSCSIIAVMLLILTAVVFRQQPLLPLKPNTIAAVLCYLSNSSLPERFAGMATLKGRERDRRVCELDLRFGMWLDERSRLGNMSVIEVDESN